METLRRKLETVYLGALVDDIREDISDIDLATNVEATRMSALDELIRRATGKPFLMVSTRPGVGSKLWIFHRIRKAQCSISATRYS